MAIEILSSEFEPNRNFDLCVLLFLFESHPHLCLLTHLPILPEDERSSGVRIVRLSAPASPSESSPSIPESCPRDGAGGGACLTGVRKGPPNCSGVSSLQEPSRVAQAAETHMGAGVHTRSLGEPSGKGRKGSWILLQ